MTRLSGMITVARIAFVYINGAAFYCWISLIYSLLSTCSTVKYIYKSTTATPLRYEGGQLNKSPLLASIMP